ncbi:hypothetical protein [Stenomitos frigidus]|uniref:hypothetical protein n=1 Tax=Stenomitos frigidus TaxID=1886765 RepID=UPI001C6371E9|nr:hypothetical protein [Stenomitos frigidus]
MISWNISPLEPDWSREQALQWWDPARRLLKTIRNYQTWQGRGGVLGYFFTKYYVAQHRFWSAVTGADIPLNCRIQGGLVMPIQMGLSFIQKR